MVEALGLMVYGLGLGVWGVEIGAWGLAGSWCLGEGVGCGVWVGFSGFGLRQQRVSGLPWRTHSAEAAPR